MKTFYMLCLLLLSLQVAGQSTSLKATETKPFKDKVKAYEITSIFTSESGETIIARNGRKKFLFDVFNTNSDKIFSEVVKSSRKEKHVGELFYNNKLNFFTVYAPKKDERILFCHTIDLNKKSYSKKTIFETTVEKKQSLFGSRKNHNTSFALSPNGNFFAIATDNIRKNKNSYTIRVYNVTSNKLVYKTAYQESSDRSFTHNDLYIDDNANVYSLGKLYVKNHKSKKHQKKTNYQFVLNKITKEGNTELLIDLDTEHIRSLRIIPNENSIQLTGFYSEINENRIKGACNFMVNTNEFKLDNKKAQVLPKQVYDDLYNYRAAKRKKKKNKELSNFEIDHVLTDSKGNTYLIAEEFYITQAYVNNGNMGGYWVTTYHYDDILILKNTKDGNLEWGRSIFKRATSPSYNAFIKNDKLHVILNSGKHLLKKKDGRTKVSRGWFESTSLYDIEYSENGDVSYNKIQDNKSKTYYSPYFGAYDMEKFIMISTKGTKKRFMTLE
ncbi:hypothetical protein [Tenacibaculum xiamenense]|uniref:hypothetical protein n=1 Tax=Tenacibaculum xiamenense TaxID=1261553 RepID=UPI0038942917